MMKPEFQLGQKLEQGLVVGIEYTDNGEEIYVWVNTGIEKKLFRQSKLVEELKKDPLERIEYGR